MAETLPADVAALLDDAKYRGLRQLLLAVTFRPECKALRNQLVQLAYRRDILDALDTRVLARLGPHENAAIAALLGRAQQPTPYDREVGDWLAAHVTPSVLLLRAMSKAPAPGTNMYLEYARAMEAVAGNFVDQYAAFVADFESAPRHVTRTRVDFCLPGERRTIISSICLKRGAPFPTPEQVAHRARTMLLDVHPHMVMRFPALEGGRRTGPTFLSLRTNLRLLPDVPDGPREEPEPAPFPVDWASLEEWAAQDTWDSFDFFGDKAWWECVC